MKRAGAILIAVTGVALALATLLYFMPLPGSTPAVSNEPRAEGGDFVLTSAAGPIALADFRGKLVVIYFGYTFCPDACPTSLGALAAALAQLPAEAAKNVRGIFVSLDPERDTPEILRDYAPYFHPAIVGVSGTPREIAAVARQYGVIYSKQRADAAGNYAVDHSSFLYLVAPDGKLAHKLAHGASPAEIAAKIQSVLKSANSSQ